MKKRERVIEINVDSRWLYAAFVIAIVIFGAVVVHAVVPDPGHAASEITGICSYDSVTEVATGCGFIDDYCTLAEYGQDGCTD